MKKIWTELTVSQANQTSSFITKWSHPPLWSINATLPTLWFPFWILLDFHFHCSLIPTGPCSWFPFCLVFEFHFGYSLIPKSATPWSSLIRILATLLHSHFDYSLISILTTPRFPFWLLLDFPFQLRHGIMVHPLQSFVVTSQRQNHGG